MQYRLEVAQLLNEIIERLKVLDGLSDHCGTHRLDSMKPLTTRLEAIRDDMSVENRLKPAINKTTELVTCLVGGPELENPAYRSLVASLLGRYQRTGVPPKAKLGGLRGGRPRKDGQPTRTLESKGYSAEVLPPTKGKGVRSHPNLRDHLRASSAHPAEG
jgi:hypothetical protein